MEVNGEMMMETRSGKVKLVQVPEPPPTGGGEGRGVSHTAAAGHEEVLRLQEVRAGLAPLGGQERRAKNPARMERSSPVVASHREAVAASVQVPRRQRRQERPRRTPGTSTS